ncbi:MAG: pyruvate synthase subunit beta, partial [Desulfobacterales bacterium]|nr:pyruvate synthase subunit beta [Desulfobacterales bacterium]
YASCPTGWGVPSEYSVKVARMAVQTNFFPLYEVEGGNRYTVNFQGNRPVRDYLRLQGRFRHLTDDQISQIQERVDDDWARLLAKCK